MNERAGSTRWYKGDQVCERYGCGLSTLYRWTAKSVFPKPEKIGLGSSRWNSDVLDEYDADPEGWRMRNMPKSDSCAGREVLGDTV